MAATSEAAGRAGGRHYAPAHHLHPDRMHCHHPRCPAAMSRRARSRASVAASASRPAAPD